MKNSEITRFAVSTILFVVLFGVAVASGLDEKSKKTDLKSVKSEKPYLLEFEAPWCGSCQNMKPLVEKLEKEEKVLVKRYDVDTDAGDAKFRYWNLKIRPGCPGIPLFVNTKTMNSICGGADYDRLKSWALEKPKNRKKQSPQIRGFYFCEFLRAISVNVSNYPCQLIGL